MLRTLDHAIDELEKSNSHYYEIEGMGSKLAGSGKSLEEALERFAKDFAKLGPGTYTVNHRDKEANYSSKLHFKLLITHQPSGFSEQISGVDRDGYAQLREEIYNLKKQSELKEIEDKYKREIETLKRKHEEENSAIAGMNHFGNLVAQIAKLAHGEPNVIAGVPQKKSTEAVYGSEAEKRVTVAFSSIQNVLGEDTTVELMEKLAALAVKDPQTVINYLKMM